MLRLTLLGAFDLTGPDGASFDAALRRTKRAALLAYLAAARPRGYHRREKIAALFWPELPDDRARAALRTTLFRLRDDCGADVVLRRGAEEIAIDRGLLTCDVAEFDDAIAAGQLENAAALYRGPLLDGVHVEGTAEELESWIETERARLHAAALRALGASAIAAAARGDHVAAIAAAERAVRLAPTDEQMARQLVSLLLAAGDRGGAIREYDDLARRLQRDLGVEPSAETVELLRAARANGTASILPASSRGSPSEPPHVASARTSTPAASPATPRLHPRPPAPRTRWYVAAALAIIAIGFAVPSMTARHAASKSGEITSTMHWQRLRLGGDSQPKPRVHEVMLLDSTSDALLIIGGIISRGENAAESPVLDDIWRIHGLDVNGSHIAARIVPERGPAPKARWQAFGAYDAAHDRAILHGGALGHSSPCASDTWILDRASGIGGHARWREVRITGESPPPRAHMAGFYEPRSRRMVTVSGNDCFATYLAEAWMLTFDDSTLQSGRWTRLTPDSSAGAPARRNGDAVAYDARARRLWVHGGHLGGGHMITELWRLDHADGSDGTPSWHPVRCAGDAPALSSHVAAYDSTTGTLMVFSGFDAAGRPRNDVWYATGLADGGGKCQWEHAVPALAEDGPLPRQSSRGVMMPGGAFVMLGGEIESFALLDMWRTERHTANATLARTP